MDKIDACPFALDRLSREVNILLVSDLHYDKSNTDPAYNARVINKKLVDSLPRKGTDWEPDVVIVAGDLVNRNNLASYEYYFHLIEQLVLKFPHLRHAVFSTPGNHDVTRDNFIDVLSYMHLLKKDKPKFKNSFTNNRLVDMLMEITKASFTDVPGLQDVLSQYEQEYFSQFLEQRTVIENMTFTGENRTFLSPLKVTYPVPGFKTTYFTSIHGITLVCHNSSFFCNISQAANDRNNLFLVRELIERTNERLAADGPLTEPVVTFMHHPFYYLHESEHISPVIDDGSGEANNNFTKIVRHSDLVLSGHVHGDLHDPAFLHNSAYLITNGTSYNTENFEGKCYPLTYALIKINKQLHRFSMRKYYFKETVPSDLSSREYVLCEQPDDRYYDFKKRKKLAPTSVETEKVRTLEYFGNLYNLHGRLQTARFLVYQLQLYHKIWRDAAGQYFNITRSPESFAGMDEIRISNSKVFTARIFLVTAIPADTDGAEEHVLRMEQILTTEMDQLNTAPDEIIYFAIEFALLREPGGKKRSKTKIDTLKTDFENLVQLSKRDYVSTNLLYYTETAEHHE